MNRDHAADSYADLAPFYDRFTATHRHGEWAALLEGVARKHGLVGRRMLDIACGTGNSALPFLRSGYEVVGCDLTPEMLEVARTKVGADVDLFTADVRDLPRVGPFDLALCVGDVLNYLLEPRDLTAAFASIARVLAPSGVAVFDVNTLGSYRTVFTRHHCVEDALGLIAWRGLAATDIAPGARVESVVDAFTAENGHWLRETSRHEHRHHPDRQIRAALRRSGLACLGVYGITPDGEVHSQPHELEHTKRLYVVGPTSLATKKGEARASDQEARDAGGSRRRLHEGHVERPSPPGAPTPGGDLSTSSRGPR